MSTEFFSALIMVPSVAIHRLWSFSDTEHVHEEGTNGLSITQDIGWGSYIGYLQMSITRLFDMFALPPRSWYRVSVVRVSTSGKVGR